MPRPYQGAHDSEVKPIYLTHLSLLNIRNYERLELDLEPGMVLLQGGNGQGKSNLLETIHVLAIAKSTRASTDRELVRHQAAVDGRHAQVSAVVRRQGERVRVQIDFTPGLGSPADEGGPQETTLQKSVRLNGAPRRISDLVGEVNAVMFSAQDLELVLSTPPVRRRYLDIMLSQLDRHYLRALQRYHRVLYQRNHLLKSVKEGRSKASELAFWNDELATSGKYIMARRAEAVGALSGIAGPVHGELTGNGEELVLVYRPGVDGTPTPSEEEMDAALRTAMEVHRGRELAQGFTVSGPHRDDVQMLLDGMDAAMFASRGQCRTVALAMRLAEASYLSGQRGQEPILLLDDVLSELDAPRRAHVLDRAGQYEQCFITSADEGPIEREYLSQMTRFMVQDGQLEPIG